MSRPTPWRPLRRATVLAVLSGVAPLSAQSTPLTLAEARSRARSASATLAASAHAVDAARARSRQAAALANPVLAWSREQATGDGRRVTQDILALEQRLDLAGLRRAHRDVAVHDAESVSAMATATRHQVDFEVAAAFTRVLASDLRAAALDRALADYARAVSESRTRLDAGDVSAYADRRLQVEWTRLATQGVEVAGNRERNRLSLQALLGGSDLAREGALSLVVDTVVPRPIALGADSLVRLAMSARADLQAARAQERAAQAGILLARRERLPAPSATLGYKRESTREPVAALSGFVLGLAVPLPIWDRRAASIEAAGASARQAGAEVLAAERLVHREVLAAHSAHQASVAQWQRLNTILTGETQSTFAAIDVAYAEGEATLLEWLDAKRAWLDLQLLRADVLEAFLASRAALERATGTLIP